LIFTYKNICVFSKPQEKTKNESKNSQNSRKKPRTQGKNLKLKEKTQPLGVLILIFAPNWC